MSTKLIVVVDDSSDIRNVVVRNITSNNFVVVGVGTPAECLTTIKNAAGQDTTVILDGDLGDKNFTVTGLSGCLMRTLQESHPSIRIIRLTGNPECIPTELHGVAVFRKGERSEFEKLKQLL